MLNGELHAAIEQALLPGRFFVAAGALKWEYRAAETLAWEIFRGRLLDERQTREHAQFKTWDVLYQPSEADPAQRIVSVRLAVDEPRLYITRELLVHGAEPFELAPDVISTRPAQICARELIGWLDWADFADPAALSAALALLVQMALVGTSRLPITSIESPLPVFSLGQVGYAPCVEPCESPARTAGQWIERGLLRDATLQQRGSVLELALRAAEPAQIAELAATYRRQAAAQGLTPADTQRLVIGLFNHTGLTPYTALVDNLLALLRELVALDVLPFDGRIDLLSYFLRHLARHLTAFDLVTFHNQGANYPDALMLDAVLADYALLIERHSEHFLGDAGADAAATTARRRRRRALRQAWILRRQYSGHLVPDVPTSPGEHARVWPAGVQRVPAEQFLQSASRRRQLFSAPDVPPPTAEVAAAFEQSLQDLSHPAELRELGTAVFLDRPLGICKAAGEADGTPLISYEAFSRQIACERLELLGRWPVAAKYDLSAWTRQLEAAVPRGIAPADVPVRRTPGVVALEDATRARADFVFVRTTGQSRAALLADYDWTALEQWSPPANRWFHTAADLLLIRTGDRSQAERGAEWLTAFDELMRPQVGLALGSHGQPGYRRYGAAERLRPGLRIVRVDGQPVDLPVPARTMFG